MPSPYTGAFASGVLPIPAFGQRSKVRFIGTWAVGDEWTLLITSTLQGDFTVGVGNIANKSPTCALKLRGRVYLGLGSQFALSANDDPTLWEEQDSGSAVVEFLSQFGTQDAVVAISSLTGRLAVFGRQSIQLWSVDADPANLALQQTLDQIGTNAPLSVKAIGDLDVLFLHYSGIRSLRANQSYLNASMNDIGTAIDLLIRDALVGYDESVACAIVEPTTKQYWLHLNGTIYVLSNYPESKIVAWSTYKPTAIGATVAPVAQAYSGLTIGSPYYWTKDGDQVSLTNGAQVLTATGYFIATATTATEGNAFAGTLQRVNTSFTPEKMVVYDGQVYIRSTAGKIYRYGGSTNAVYDSSLATIELPWLDLKEPSMTKQVQGLDVAWSGNWDLQLSTNPRTSAYTSFLNRGSTTSPSMVIDSTFDIGHFGAVGNGTHIKIKAISGPAETNVKLGKIVIQYAPTNMK